MNNVKMFMLWFVQVMTIHNAISLGWNVRKIGLNKYELTLNKNDSRTSWDINCFERMIKNIVAYDILEK